MKDGLAVDWVSTVLGIATAVAGLVIIRLIGYLTGDPPDPSSEWVGGAVGASLAASAIARGRALRQLGRTSNR